MPGADYYCPHGPISSATDCEMCARQTEESALQIQQVMEKVRELAGQLEDAKQQRIEELTIALQQALQERDASRANRDVYAARLAETTKHLQQAQAALEEYGMHREDCILSHCSQGRPTASGGYESMYKGVWYEVRPVDKTPKCGCGFNTALQAGPGGSP